MLDLGRVVFFEELEEEAGVVREDSVMRRAVAFDVWVISCFQPGRGLDLSAGVREAMEEGVYEESRAFDVYF
jgi:hypothetical protein